VSNHHSLTGLRAIEEEIFEILFNLCNERREGERVKMKYILDHVEVSKARLTNIIRRKLEPEGYVDYLPYEGIMLTDKGYAIAKAMQRNHCLAEALLGNILGMEWTLIHEEACQLEHGITDAIASHILAKLGPNPLTPYGYVIPDSSPTRCPFIYEDTCLLDSPVNVDLVLARIDPAKQLLAKLKSVGITKIGIKIVKIHQDEESATIEVNGTELKLDIHECQMIRVA